MREVSRAWQRTMTGSFTPVFSATLCTFFQSGTRPAGRRLDIVDGTVSLDGAADIYAALDLTVPGELWPQPFGDNDLAPYGSEIYIKAGVKYSDALIETVGLGYFRIRTDGQEDAESGGEITLTGEDRMSTIARAKMLAPLQFSATVTNGQFATALVSEVYPRAEIEWDDDVENAPIGRDIVVEDDRLAALKSMAKAASKLMRWDHRGILTFRTVPNPLTTPLAARLTSGRGGVLVKASRELSDAGVVNAIVARGDGADQVGAAYGLAIDADPNSPTNYYGRFGPSPDYLTSSFITTNAIANIAAQAELRRRSGLPHTISFEISPRFELEPDDLVHIEHRNGVGRHLIAALDIPLVPGGTMTGTTREQLLRVGA